MAYSLPAGPEEPSTAVSGARVGRRKEGRGDRARTEMTIQALLFLGGLALLYGGAEALVAGAVRLARAVGLGPLVIGLTVVAFGTSAPELVVSVLAALAGTPDVAVGNVVGSNIANIALILALAAVFSPLRVESRVVAREIPLVIVVSAAFLLMLVDGRVGRVDGALLLTGFVGYLGAVLWAARRTRAPEPAGNREAAGDPKMGGAPDAAGDPPGRLPHPLPGAVPDGPRGGRPWAAILLVLVGLGTLLAGAHLLIESSVWFARRVGISDLVIGLTLVAVGTSLPELATSTIAAIRGQADLAVGNVVGSNLFNLLAILGSAALVRPLPAAPELLTFQGPVMLGAAALLLPLAWTRFELQRWEGALLLMGYAGFLGALVATSG